MKGREEWQPYIAAWRERKRREAEERERQVQAGRAAALKCAQALVEQHGARRVWLFGSLVHRRFLHAAHVTSPASRPTSGRNCPSVCPTY
ncbi:MAG TPA: hypothetical protein EYP77_02270 [Anaerolineae bacterium]|nr:hypothetical protein [Anaerolineae bacterium]